MSRDNGEQGAENKALLGFLQFLSAPDRVPDFTPEVEAYLERAGTDDQLSDDEAYRIAKATVLATTRKRLQSANVSGIRPLGKHLCAKRLVAQCSAAQISFILGEQVWRYERLESGDRDPFEIPRITLARIVYVFGLGMSELRQALVLHCEAPYQAYGIRFARGGHGPMAKEQLSVAAEDLRSSATKKRPANNDAIQLVDRTVAEVRQMLETL